MNKIQKLFIFSVFVLSIFTVPSANAEVKILSPSSKSTVWANKQALVINATEGEDIFYTFTGTNPLETGFAYDEPVLIDATGDVELYVTSINKKKERTDYVIKYSVDENLNQQLKTVEEVDFIKKMNETSITSVTCGQELSIPYLFSYSMTSYSDDETMENGRSINVSEDSTLDRYVSLVLKNESGSYWNYILHLVPVVKGEFSKAAVPFEIEEWSKVKLLDNKYIYSIDDGWWQRSGQTFDIDRSVTHVIKWQSVDYDQFNPVQSYEIPATPEVKAELQENGTVILTFNGDERYRFAGSRKSQIVSAAAGLHQKIVVDAFQGENFSTLLPLDIYSENVYQGQLFASVQVNRKKPDVPEIVFGNYRDVNRNDVSFYIKAGDDETKIKYFVSGPQRLSFEQLTYGSKFSDSEKIDSNSFAVYTNNEIKLRADAENPVVYCVYAYCIDKCDNVSDIVSADVVIDKCNYFVKAGSDISDPDGTYNKPFNNISDLEKIVNSSTYTNIYVYGKVNVESKELKFKQDFSLNGINDAEIVFEKTSSLNITGANCTLNNILVKSLNTSGDYSPVLINVSNGILSMNNCELSFGRYKSAVLLNASKSLINLMNSGMTAYANDYAAVINSNGSKINVKNCRLSTVASTNVNISSRKSKLSLTDSQCNVSGLNGRVVELFGSEAVISSNTFIAKNNDRTKNVPVWKDDKSKVDESRNKSSGF